MLKAHLYDISDCSKCFFNEFVALFQRWPSYISCLVQKRLVLQSIPVEGHRQRKRENRMRRSCTIAVKTFRHQKRQKRKNRPTCHCPLLIISLFKIPNPFEYKPIILSDLRYCLIVKSTLQPHFPLKIFILNSYNDKFIWI